MKNKNSTVTIPLNDYNALLAEIGQQKDYIKKHVDNGEIDVKYMLGVIAFRDYGSHYYEGLNVCQSIQILKSKVSNIEQSVTKEQLDKINNEEFTRAINEMNECKESMNKELRVIELGIQQDLDDVKNMSWLDRLVFLFGGC